MKRYIVLIIVIILLMAAYTAYWFFALDQAKKGFAAFVAGERARGNVLTFATAEWGGFPIRIGVDLTEVAWSSSDVAFAAGKMRVEAMPWRPTHGLIRAEHAIIVRWADSESPEAIEAKPSLILGSIRFTTDGAFSGADIELRNAPVAGTRNDGSPYALFAGRLQVDARFVAGTARGRETFDIAFSADRIDLPPVPAPRLGPRIAGIRFSARLSDLPPFSRGWRPADRDELVNYLGESGTTAEIARMDLDWGQVSAKGTGRLALDAANRPTGQLDFKVIGIRQLIDALTANGVIEPGGPILSDVAGGTPVPLVLKDGLVTFGPFTVGELDRLN